MMCMKLVVFIDIHGRKLVSRMIPRNRSGQSEGVRTIIRSESMGSQVRWELEVAGRWWSLTIGEGPSTKVVAEGTWSADGIEMEGNAR